MLPKDLLQKIRRIEITTSRLVSEMFAGQYHSVFKGQGIEFDEVREYQEGDDIRTIDWNVTARTGKPHVKKFIEERELNVMLLVDASRSCNFASVNILKNRLAAEVAAMLAMSATGNNDKVGLVHFTDRIEKFIPARKGRQHVLRVIREILYFKPQGTGTDMAGALEYLNKITTRHSIVFLISDFIGYEEEGPTANALRKMLTVSNKRHDIVAVTLNDKLEYELPDAGMVVLEDAETGEEGVIDTSDPEVRSAYESHNRKRKESREQLFRSCGIDFIDVFTDKPYTDAFIKFFGKRRRRLNR
jgi:uncharacterized protein (DUF58 family)